MGLKPDLFVPHKNMNKVNQPDYGNDMRAIEIWAKGVRSGQSAGALGFQATGPTTGASRALWGAGNPSFTATSTLQGIYPVLGGGAGIPPNYFVSGNIVTAIIGNGGFVVSPTSSGVKNIWQSLFIFAPVFTGPTSTVTPILYLSAIEMGVAAPEPNAMNVATHSFSLASGTTHSYGSGGYQTANIVGTDLAFSATGVLSCGNSGGTSPPYIVAWSMQLTWDITNTFSES